MTDHKTESEPRKEDEELTLEKEKIRDLDVPEEESENVKGGVRDRCVTQGASGCTG